MIINKDFLQIKNILMKQRLITVVRVDYGHPNLQENVKQPQGLLRPQDM